MATKKWMTKMTNDRTSCDLAYKTLCAASNVTLYSIKPGHQTVKKIVSWISCDKTGPKFIKPELWATSASTSSYIKASCHSIRP